MRQFIVIFFATCLMGPGALWGASANITQVEGNRVEIDIGSSRGIVVGMTADVLSDAGRIVHPITGEDYGARRVKIAEMAIVNVESESAVGHLVVIYAPVKVGDSADGLVAIQSPEERMQMDIDEARAEIKALARDLADEINGNKKAIDDLRRTLTRINSSERRLRSVMNEVMNMRERMVVMQSRMAQIEEYQTSIDSDSSEVATQERIGEIEARMTQLESQQEELTTMAKQTKSAATDSGKAGMKSPSLDEPIDDLFDDEEEVVEETPWYMSLWFLGIVVTVVGLLIGGAILFLKKQKGGGSPDSSDEMGDDEVLADDGFEEVGDDDMVEELPDDLPELEIAEEES